MKAAISCLVTLLAVLLCTSHPHGGGGRSSIGGINKSIAKRSGGMSAYYETTLEYKPPSKTGNSGTYLNAYAIIGIILAVIAALFFIYYGLKFYLNRYWDSKVEENANNYAHMSDTLPLGDYKRNKEKEAIGIQQKVPEPKMYIGFNVGLFPNGPKAPKMSDRDYLMDSEYKNADISIDHPDHHSVHSSSATSESNVSPSPSPDREQKQEPQQTRVSQTELSVPLRKDEIETTI